MFENKRTSLDYIQNLVNSIHADVEAEDSENQHKDVSPQDIFDNYPNHILTIMDHFVKNDHPIVIKQRLQKYIEKVYSKKIVEQCYKTCKCLVCVKMKYPILIKYDKNPKKLVY